MSIWGAVVGVEFTQSDLGINLVAGCGEWEGLALNFCLQSSPLLCTSLPAVVGCRQLDGGYWGNLRPHLNAFGPGVQTKLLSRK